MSRSTTITLNVNLDENQVPETITWNAEDGGIRNEQTKAALVSVWDEKAKEALRIDLWTKDMPVDDMKIFMHQVLISLSHTYQRATGQDDVTDRMLEFSEEFAEISGIR